MKFLTIILTALIFSACQSKDMKDATTYAFRLKPGEDIKEGIEKVIKEEEISFIA